VKKPADFDLLTEQQKAELETKLMAVKAETLKDLCELYPKSADVLKQLSIIKSQIKHHYRDVNIQMHQKMQEARVKSQANNEAGASSPSQKMFQKLVKRQKTLALNRSHQSWSSDSFSESNESVSGQAKQKTREAGKLEKAKNQLVGIMTRIGNELLIENAVACGDWALAKKARAGEYSFKMHDQPNLNESNMQGSMLDLNE